MKLFPDGISLYPTIPVCNLIHPTSPGLKGLLKGTNYALSPQ